MDEQEFISDKLPKLRRSCFDVLKGYVPGDQPQNIERWIKLNTNENPYPPPNEVIVELNLAIKQRLRMYPDPTAKNLREAILDKYLGQFDIANELSINNIVTANGSDETLDILFKTFIDKGDNVLYCDPSYGMYPVLAETYEATKVVIPLSEEDFSLPLDKLDFKPQDKLFIICSPNNPNGDSVPLSVIDKICLEFPGIVFVDEAYGDFALESAISIVPKYPNLIVGKTFSKSFGMASIRLGFAVAHKEVIKLFNTIRLPYNVTYLTQIAGTAALNVWSKIQENIDKIISERDKMIKELKEIGYEILPSQSNFLLMRFSSSKESNYIFNELKKQKILTRYWSSEKLNRYIRVTIGTPEQNTKFMEAIKNIDISSLK